MAEPLPEHCRACARRVPWLSLFGNLGLAVYKLIVGTLGRSAALVADAMHSFADVIGSTGILVATKVSAKHPDETFPYGRGKAEFVGAVFVYTILLVFSVGITVSSVAKIFSDNLEPPHLVTLLGAGVSVFYNFVMYRYATCVGKRNRSPAILADAFENRADAISSVACIAGIFGAMVLHPICDPIAALIVGFVIFWNCQEQLREAASGLMDVSLPHDEVELIKTKVGQLPGVEAVSYLHSRRTGAKFWIDLGIEVDPGLRVDEADKVVDTARRTVERVPDCHHVEVYVVTEPDPSEETDQPWTEAPT